MTPTRRNGTFSSGTGVEGVEAAGAEELGWVTGDGTVILGPEGVITGDARCGLASLLGAGNTGEAGAKPIRKTDWPAAREVDTTGEGRSPDGRCGNATWIGWLSGCEAREVCSEG